MNYINDVKEFHETFNVSVGDYKENIDLKIRQLRIKLIFEELKELAEACDVMSTFTTLCMESLNQADNQKLKDNDSVNKKEELDALCDLQYVLSGSVLSLGYHNVFEEAFSEVHSSNMSKVCDSQHQLEVTMTDYKNKGVETYSVEKNGKYLVFRKEDNKVLKNSFYKEANLNQFVD